MIFPSTVTVPIPQTDLISYIFDDPTYDRDKPVLIDALDPSRSFSYNQAVKFIRQLTAGLHAAGLQKGDVVCVHSFNDIHYVILFLSIVAAGGVFTGTNPSYGTSELQHHYTKSRTKFLITEPELLPKITEAAEKSSIPNSRIWIFDLFNQEVPSGFQSWKTLLTHGEVSWDRYNDEARQTTTPAARLFSSGSSGLPKAADLSHRNFVAEDVQTKYGPEKPYEIRRLIILPLFHAAAAPVAHINTFKAGFETYIMRRFDKEKFLNSVQKYQITETSMVPPIVFTLLQSPLATPDVLKSLRDVHTGGAPLDKDTQNAFQARLSPESAYTQVLGMTESCAVVAQTVWPERDETGSIGYFLPNIDVKLIDPDGAPLTDPTASGELCVRGPSVFNGYFENPEANATSFDAEGFFITGDIARRDPVTKKWYIVDRRKELIKVRGFQVAPAEIEAVLVSHPQIAEAAVIGVHSGPNGGEVPRAYVVRAAGVVNVLTEEDVKDFVKGRLAKYKQLDGGVEFLAALPKSPIGKIIKKVLREKAKKEIGSPEAAVVNGA